jgi:hypothetical protein
MKLKYNDYYYTIKKQGRYYVILCKMSYGLEMFKRFQKRDKVKVYQFNSISNAKRFLKDYYTKDRAND